MENQHRKIKGYRELNAEEIALMNEIKAKGEELRELVARCQTCIKDVPYLEPGIQYECDHPAFWLRWAEGSFRTGVMYAVRAIAQPTSY